MRTSVHVLAALAAAGLTTASAQNAGNPARPPGAQTPVQQPRTSAPPSAPTSSPRTSPTPSQPTQPSSQATPSQPTQTTRSSQTSTPAQPTQTTRQAEANATGQQTQPSSNTQQTVRPPDSARADTNTGTDDDLDDTNNAASNRANNATRQNQSRVPPAMRGVGTTGSRPDCTKLRGIEKAECERRDTSRDDLPAGVTTTQPERPQE